MFDPTDNWQTESLYKIQTTQNSRDIMRLNNQETLKKACYFSLLLFLFILFFFFFIFYCHWDTPGGVGANSSDESGHYIDKHLVNAYLQMPRGERF